MIDGRHSVNEIAQAIRTGQVSAVEVTAACLQDIQQFDAHYNSFTEITANRALEEAAAIDNSRKLGKPLPPLAGVPYAVKNLFDITGISTLAGSKINQANPPASQDAILVGRMQQAGAILLGALNMDEYAYGFTTENHHYGPSRNPHDPSRSAGGSSGGSAAAVAAGFVPVTLGSDTNGSVRVPASLCGLFGLKPTYGTLALDGMFPFVHSFDHAGIFARHSADLECIFNVLQPSHQSDTSQETSADTLRIARLDGYFSQGDSQSQQAVEKVCQALAVKQTLELPEVSIARAAAYVITASEGGNRHLSRLQTQVEDFDPLTRPRLAAGTLVPAAWYIQAQRFRNWFHNQVMQRFQQYDILIAPATPCCAQPLGQETIHIQGKSMLLRPNMGMFTQPISFIGLPVIAVPVQSAGQMPIAVQLIAPPRREDWLFTIAAKLEQAGICLAPVTRQ